MREITYLVKCQECGALWVCVNVHMWPNRLEDGTITFKSYCTHCTKQRPISIIKRL